MFTVILLIHDVSGCHCLRNFLWHQFSKSVWVSVAVVSLQHEAHNDAFYDHYFYFFIFCGQLTYGPPN